MTTLHERLQDFADDYPVTCDIDRKAVALLREAAAALRSKQPAAREGDVVPDPVLCQFYQVETVAQLLAAQEEHILKLQETVRHNVKPWEDTFPPTLLPKYLRESGLDNTSKQVAGETWQPIETAPKDGTHIIVYSPDRCKNCPANSVGMSIVCWDGGYWVSGKLVNGMWISLEHAPTLWHPLPNINN